MSLSKLGHKRHCDFCFALSLTQSRVTHSGGSQLPHCEHTQATKGKAAGPPTNSHVREPGWKQLIQMSCLQTLQSRCPASYLGSQPYFHLFAEHLLLDGLLVPRIQHNENHMPFPTKLPLLHTSTSASDLAPQPPRGRSLDS